MWSCAIQTIIISIKQKNDVNSTKYFNKKRIPYKKQLEKRNYNFKYIKQLIYFIYKNKFLLL